MISTLTGPIQTLTTTSAIVECSGVGYEAFCPARTLAQLEIGKSTRLYTVLVVREDAHILFGFSSQAEKAFFTQLTSVSGVGPKMGLSLLSTFTAAEIQSAIAANQPTTLAKASGVGKKLAEKIIVELKDKLGQIPLFISAGTPASTILTDLTSALTNLGYQPKTAESAAQEALKANPSAPFEQLFKLALSKAA